MRNQEIIGPVIDLGRIRQSVYAECSANAGVASVFGTLFSLLAFLWSVAYSTLAIRTIYQGHGVKFPQSLWDADKVADYVSQFVVIGLCFILIGTSLALTCWCVKVFIQVFSQNQQKGRE